MANDKPVYLVKKVIYRYYWCPSCNGSSTQSRTFRGQKFVAPCYSCNGTGRKRTEQSTEIPLLEALKELNLIKD